jgi:hypothetical protein
LSARIRCFCRLNDLALRVAEVSRAPTGGHVSRPNPGHRSADAGDHRGDSIGAVEATQSTRTLYPSFGSSRKYRNSYPIHLHLNTHPGVSVKSDLFEADHEAYRQTVRRFVENEIVPNLE